jgi:RTX calcium-binding nonapeptide repeat (4 copies)
MAPLLRTSLGRPVSALGLAGLMIAACACVALGKASHAGWPRIDGLVLLNESDQSRPLSGLPDAHNELLGGHGDDTIEGGNLGDVIWGDYKPCCQPASQVDHLYGGPGKDFIYSSHGINYIYTGGGRDVVHAHFGRGGEIHCDSPDALVYVSHRSRPRYRFFGCANVRYGKKR